MRKFISLIIFLLLFEPCFAQEVVSKMNKINSLIINESSIVITKAFGSICWYNDSTIITCINNDVLLLLNINTGQITNFENLSSYITKDTLQSYINNKHSKNIVNINNNTDFKIKSVQPINASTILCFFTKGITKQIDSLTGNTVSSFSVEINILSKKYENIKLYPFGFDEDTNNNSILSYATYMFNDHVYTHKFYFSDFEISILNIYNYNTTSFIKHIQEIKNIPYQGKSKVPLMQNPYFFEHDKELFVQTRTELFKIKNLDKIISFQKILPDIQKINKCAFYKNYILLNYMDSNQIFSNKKIFHKHVIIDRNTGKVIENKQLETGGGIYKNNVLYQFRKDENNWYIDKYEFNLN